METDVIPTWEETKQILIKSLMSSTDICQVEHCI